VKNRLMSIADYSRQNYTLLHSFCALRDMATEFSCLGLKLDLPIVCWGNDFLLDGKWKNPSAKRSKVKDPHQLRVNSYQVLLTRGRDGFIVFVPNEIGIRDIRGVERGGNKGVS
jgi:energy-converting hydrogenase A subunit M